jgi:hypothetical protein
MAVAILEFYKKISKRRFFGFDIESDLTAQQLQISGSDALAARI